MGVGGLGMGELRVEGLCKGWDFPVVDRLDLSVAEGEFFVVVGPSGIGKTTLLRLIAGLERPDAGRVLVGGRDVTALPPYRRNVAMTFESYALYPHLSVFENVASPLRARRLPRSEIDAAVRQVTAMLRIDGLLERRPGEISGGQKQRTALARTLVAKPEVYLLDEPISHLDARIRHELRQQFHGLEELRRVATLYVTHDYAEALSLGDRIGVMGAGGLVQVGTARDVFERPASLFVARHLGQPSINVIEGELRETGGGALHFAAAAEGGGGEGLTLPVAEAHRAALLAGNTAGVQLGIRPQYVSVLENGADGGARSGGASGAALRADGGGRAPAGAPGAADSPLAADASGAADAPGFRGGGRILDATVELYEPLGAAGVLLANAGGVPLTAITSPDRTFVYGERVRLRLRPETTLYFDPASGRNLVR